VDLHALSLGRSMMLARGGIAFVVGACAANQSAMTATSLIVVWGVWALADGAATLRQAYPPSGTSARAKAQPVMLVLGGVSLVVGVLSIAVFGLSPETLTWVLAGWFAVRAGFETLGAYAVRAKARTLLGAAALADLGLVAVFATHTSGSVVNLALFGGGLTLVWSLLYLTLGLVTPKVHEWTPEGPRLLSRR
jgi:uncharacterized membrane protein HdeD (DUF308 family)